MDFLVRKSTVKQRLRAGDNLQQPEEMEVPPPQPVLDFPEEELEQAEEMALPSTQIVVVHPQEGQAQTVKMALPSVVSAKVLITEEKEVTVEMDLPSSQTVKDYRSWFPHSFGPWLKVSPQYRPPPRRKEERHHTKWFQRKVWMYLQTIKQMQKCGNQFNLVVTRMCDNSEFYTAVLIYVTYPHFRNRKKFYRGE
ncbi:uncharacterized protein LOC133202117 [Saccostrea echinata]|uniref:uncharacterized protein LOC133202117 n=1 Tax=Saccostrea echinata TaxID=191078 RepID=UPI002A80A850|nr:uncharacterized protein LOC133202117 [Saccostrea echinata]